MLLFLVVHGDGEQKEELNRMTDDYLKKHQDDLKQAQVRWS